MADRLPEVVPDRTANAIGAHNTKRNPQRTASTAAALMIGLALVTLVAVLASGIIATFEGAVDDIFTSDYAITAQNNFSPIPISAGKAAAKAPGVETLASVRAGEAQDFNSTQSVTAVDPDVGSVLDAGVGGWMRRPCWARLGRDGAFVDDGVRGQPPPLASARGSRSDPHGATGSISSSRGSSSHRVAARRSAASRSRAATWDAILRRPPRNLYSFVQMQRRRDRREHEPRSSDAARARSRTRSAQTRQEFVDNADQRPQRRS